MSSIAGSGEIKLGAGTLTTIGNTSTTFSGIMSGSGGFIKSGTSTLTLSGENTYSGPTNITGGILEIATINGSATGAGNVIVGVSGTLAGTGTIGILSGQGNTTVNGALEPGSATLGGVGELTIRGGLTMGSTGKIIMELGETIGLVSDKIDIADGNVMLEHIK